MNQPFSSKQLAVLDAMGIPVWQRRTVVIEQDSAQPDSAGAQEIIQSAFEAPGVPGLAADADWSQLRQMVSGCRACPLHAGRTNTVFGTGNPQADWLFVGEAPGGEEDKQGEPFVGRAGQLLSAMLAALGLDREKIYIANVLKCRPPLNRDPQLTEVEQCEPFLLRQVELIQPKIIVALGRFAAHSLLRTDLAVGKLRNQQHDYHNTPLVVTYHPAFLLRNPADKKKAWHDLCLARSVVKSGVMS
ncbi:MAG: uracil-DNA glycosylase [Gammaproteobacteria bacterium]|nr:uracil-DNA glycosylase [Gammaproteobacteria bacterium]